MLPPFELLRVAFLALSLTLAQAPPAQTTPPHPPDTQPLAAQPAPEVVFHATTRLVQVNVVVHDRQGQPVGDLKKEDFSITEKGKPQEISFFSVESLDKLPAAPPKLPPHIFTNQLALRESVPPSVTVILLDSLNTNFADQNYARKAVIDFLLQVKPSDHIAIYRLSNRLQILHDYTTDSAELIQRLLESRGETLPQMEASQGNGFDLGPVIGGRGGNRWEAAFFMNDRILRTLTAIDAIANHMASVPGRKNLVWVSDGIPLAIGSVMSKQEQTYSVEVERTERALNDADVSVYAVDARGLVPPRQFSAENSQINARVPPRPTAVRTPISRPLDSLIELADRTGGRAFYNTNDLKNAIRQAIGDSEITYTLGYHPTNTEMDGKFREIKVKVNRPGVNVRYRKGYVAVGPANQDPKVREEELFSALWSPLDATALPLNARVDFVDQPQPNTVQVAVQVIATGLNLTVKEGRYTGQVDIFMAQKDDRGNQLGEGVRDTLALNLKPESYTKMMQQGLIYRKALPRDIRASNLRVVVRDTGTGAIGSVTVPYKEIQ